MSYIGQGLPADTFQGFVTDSFTGDGSATTFTLSKEPFSEDTLIVVINNVIQKPTTNFTVSGTTLTIVGTAVASGDVIYAIHMGGPLPIGGAAELDLNGASDKLILDADADTTISADTDDQIDFKIGGADAMSLGSDFSVDVANEIILDADGGIVKFRDGGSGVGRFANSSSDFVIQVDNQDNDIIFKGDDGGSVIEAMRIDISAGGYVGLGTATPSNLLHLNSTGQHPTVEVRSTQSPNGSSYGGTIELALGDDGASGSGHADTQSGDNIGRVQFTGQGTDYSYGAGLVTVVVTTGDGDDPRGNQGCAMAFYTKSVGNSSNSEKFRIAANGDLTATDTSISSNSDERLKENIQDYTYDINKFKQFKAKTFDWKNPTEHGGRSNNRGFIAQDILAIDDYWVDQVDLSSMKSQFKDVETEPEDTKLIPAASDGSRLAYTSKFGKKDAMYISVIQQLITRIEALEDA